MLAQVRCATANNSNFCLSFSWHLQCNRSVDKTQVSPSYWLKLQCLATTARQDENTRKAHYAVTEGRIMTTGFYYLQI